MVIHIFPPLNAHRLLSIFSSSIHDFSFLFSLSICEVCLLCVLQYNCFWSNTCFSANYWESSSVLSAERQLNPRKTPHPFLVWKTFSCLGCSSLPRTVSPLFVSGSWKLIRPHQAVHCILVFFRIHCLKSQMWAITRLLSEQLPNARALMQILA